MHIARRCDISTAKNTLSEIMKRSEALKTRSDIFFMERVDVACIYSRAIRFERVGTRNRGEAIFVANSLLDLQNRTRSIYYVKF